MINSKLEGDRQLVTEERNWRSEHASATARNLCLGVVAVVWGLLTANNNVGIATSPWQHVALACAGLFAVTSLFADWLQAIIGYIAVDRDYDRVTSSRYDPTTEEPFTKDGWYATTVLGFRLKQLFAPASFVALLVAIIPGILRKI